MRRELLPFLMLLHAAVAAGGEVTVLNPTIRIVTSVQQMRDRCALEGTYDACTQFVAYRLNAACAADDSSWRVHASAAFTPLIILYNLRSLTHEHEHIGDMRDSLTRYLDGLQARTFDSETRCDAAAADAIDGFDATMREFAAESLRLRDPTLH